MAKDWIGQRLGNYQLVSLLGRGGFAEVYLGEHIHLGTQAAVKVLTTELTSNKMEQFRNEASHDFQPGTPPYRAYARI